MTFGKDTFFRAILLIFFAGGIKQRMQKCGIDYAINFAIFEINKGY